MSGYELPLWGHIKYYVIYQVFAFQGAVISPSDEDSQTFTVNTANSEAYRLRGMSLRIGVLS